METIDVLGALQEVEKRADRALDDEQVLNTYVQVDALVAALEASDNGIIFGRRGTGKTHALRYLEQRRRANTDFAVYIDLAKLGSTEGLYADPLLPVAERSTRLLVDVLGSIHTALLEEAFTNDSASGMIAPLDKVLDHFGEVLVVDEAAAEIRTARASERSKSAGIVASLNVTAPSVGASATDSTRVTLSAAERFSATGPIRHRVHFGEVSHLMQQAAELHPARRIWLLLDEWSGLPLDVQPFLAEMLRRVFFGIPKVTVRIAAIPHRTVWRIRDADRGMYVGVEVGAEIFPLLDLDEFVVFPARNRMEQARRSGEFFKALLLRHVNQSLVAGGKESLADADELMRLLFTQITAMEEMIRAAEGVPRDALAIVSRAALRAGDRKVSTDHIRDAAAQVYQTTKAALLNGTPEARAILELIITDVISRKKARAFLLPPDQTDDPVIQQLIDDRILHLIKRGYSSKDDPGTRFDVLQIDYGCYVHLLRTESAPQGLFGEGAPSDDTVLASFYEGAAVPADDYRAIRRAVLDLPQLRARLPTHEDVG